jgi:DNA primase
VNTLDLALKKVKLRKVSGTHGGEWQGPCPGCGGTDRFHVWPEQQEGKGSYWCRSCEKSGDNIQFLIDFEDLTFKEACAQLNVTLPDRPAPYRVPPPLPQTKPEFTPTTHAAPIDLWQERAEKFIAWAESHLPRNPEIIAWLAARGISAETASAYRLGWNPGENDKDIYRARTVWGLPEIRKEDGKLKALWIPRGLVIPWITDGVIHRIRIRRPDGEPRYYVIPGSTMSTMILEQTRRAFVIVESELDAIAISANTRTAGTVALGSVSAKPDAAAHGILKNAIQILNALDYDAAGAKAMEWWKEQFNRCDRWPVPKGKDPGEAFQMGIDLDQWIKVGLPPALTIETKPTSGETKARIQEPKRRNPEPVEGLSFPPAIQELLKLLLNNPGVKIINTRDRFTVLRNGKYVGGRIAELVFQTQTVTDYLMNHSAEEIDGGNLIR